MQQIELHPEDYLPAAPSQEIVQRYGIAIVGCGKTSPGTHIFPPIKSSDIVSLQLATLSKKKHERLPKNTASLSGLPILKR